MSAGKQDLPEVTTEVPALPPRAPTTHKGQAGHVAIVAGSRGMTGAAVLSALGALRGGAGLTRVYCATSLVPIVAVGDPCLMTVGLPEHEDGQVDGETALGTITDGWAHALAIGPGLGQSDTLPGLISGVLRTVRQPVVLDADGLNNLARMEGVDAFQAVWSTRSFTDLVVTPHPGEMSRLREAAGLQPMRGDDDATRLRLAHEFATWAGVTVVLKGHRTVVSTPEAAYVNKTGNPGMATGGMGDVLTGLIAALLAQGMEPFAAARLGVYAHGLAADRCAKQIGGVGYLARDVADDLPGALLEASRPRIGFV
jgi:NAD(P)H-hydrate epimerase